VHIDDESLVTDELVDYIRRAHNWSPKFIEARRQSVSLPPVPLIHGRYDRTDEGVLTENVAILTYLARSFPHAKLLPEEPIGMARCLSHMAYLSNTVHPAFTQIVRPGRFATDESAHENLKATGRDNSWKLLQELDGILDGKEWVMGSQYSAADPCTLVI
jgi:glutathione S-transferase